MPCPSCRTPLERAHQRHGLFACPTCGGIWADQQASTTLSRTADASVSAVSQMVSNKARWAAPANVPGRPCPVCHAPMRQATFGSVHLDACHGTWFDKDELTTVMREVQAWLATQPAAAPKAAPKSSGTGGAVAMGVLEILFDILD